MKFYRFKSIYRLVPGREVRKVFSFLLFLFLHFFSNFIFQIIPVTSALDPMYRSAMTGGPHKDSKMNSIIKAKYGKGCNDELEIT